LYPVSGISYEKIVQKKDPGNDPQCDTSDTIFSKVIDLYGLLDRMYPVSKKVYENVQKKIPVGDVLKTPLIL